MRRLGIIGWSFPALMAVVSACGGEPCTQIAAIPSVVVDTSALELATDASVEVCLDEVCVPLGETLLQSASPDRQETTIAVDGDESRRTLVVQTADGEILAGPQQVEIPTVSLNGEGCGGEVLQGHFVIDAERPVVVLLHGLEASASGSMIEWADTLEDAGAIVVNADWFPPGDRMPDPSVDGALSVPGVVRCVIDEARLLGSEGGDVTVVAVSAGAYQAVLTALAWESFDRPACGAPAGPRPETIVALAGAFDAARRGPLATALSGEPVVLGAVDPFEYVDVAVETRFVVIHGDADPIIPLSAAEAFVGAVAQVGGDVELHVVEGGKHFEFGSPSTAEGAAALPIILDAFGSP